MALQPIQQSDIINLFNYKNKQFRAVTDIYNNKIWFSGRDGATILDYKNTRQAINKHVNKNDRITFGTLLRQNRLGSTDRLLQNIDEQAIMINESGLYDLAFESHKQEAKAFRRWVMTEVLPSIRKTGSYSMHPNKQLALTPQQQLQKQHLDNEAKKLDMDKLKLCQQVIDKSDTPQNKRYFEQYLLNSLDYNPTSSNVKAIEYTDPNSYMNDGVTQLAVEHNITTAYNAQKYGSPCGRYVAKQYRKKYPNDPIKKGKKIFCANNTYISPNTYKHKYKNEIIGWIREYFNSLDSNAQNDKNKAKQKKSIRSRSTTVRKK